MIYKHYRIVGAIDIGIETKAGRIVYVTEIVGRDESAPFGVVVAALQIIAACFRIIVIAAVTQGVDLHDLFLLRSIIPYSGLNRAAPFIIGIFYNGFAC